MRHARSDYDAIQPWPTQRPHIVKVDGRITTQEEWVGSTEWVASDARMEPVIPDDEPVFLIRGQDLAAIPAALAWCKAAADLGADPAIIQAVERHIELVRDWQQAHAAKVPDAPSGALR